jgi:spermidine synthase
MIWKRNVSGSFAVPASQKFLPWLLLLFFGSGCAALIYEIVWLQLLELVVGSSGVSLGVLLGTFMGGMCLGSLLLPRIISPRLHPLRVYALLELGIGFFGIAVLFGLPVIADFYTSLYWHGIFSRALVAAMCLLPPAVLMGATLPVAARFVESTPRGVSWMGFFYGGNLMGAVIGCLAAGFYLLRIYDMPTASHFAVAINISVALIALVLAAKSSYQTSAAVSPEASTDYVPSTGLVHLAIALSGLCALGGEVIYTRLLSLLLGGTVYTFSIILAVFLIGLGIGSSAGAALTRSSFNPRTGLFICQMLLAGAIAWAAFLISASLPYWPVDPGIYTGDYGPWHLFQLDLLRTAWTILPATILWGASFPLALAAVAHRGSDPGRMVGKVYAANTVGAIAGSLAFSMFVIPRFGTQWGERWLIILSAVSAIAALASAVLSNRFPAKSRGPAAKPALSFSGVVATVAGFMIVVFLVQGVSAVPWAAVAWGRYTASYIADAAPGLIDDNAPLEDSKGMDSPSWFCTYVGEGMNVSVAVTKTAEGSRFFHGAGKVQASSQPQDMRLQRMLGHLSALICENPARVEDVMVIACGAGVTAGSFILYPDVKHITICDIEPLVPKIVAPMFGKENYHIVDGIDRQNPHVVNGKEVRVIYDDGRHYISTLPENVKFDVITSDPIDPWVKGSAALNTVEYYEICKRHLKPGGVMSLWIPLYESSFASAKSIIATFFEVFPDGMIFSNDELLEGYDAVLIGRAEPAAINLDRIRTILDRRDYASVRQSLEDVGFGMNTLGNYSAGLDIAVDLFSTYAGQATDLQVWTRSAQINRDRNLRLQYLAGMGYNLYIRTAILESILSDYRFPDKLFLGTPETIRYLKSRLQEGRRISSQ